MTEERLVLAELLEKAGEGDFVRAVAEAVLQLLMESDVEGLIGAGRYAMLRPSSRLTHIRAAATSVNPCTGARSATSTTSFAPRTSLTAAVHFRRGDTRLRDGRHPQQGQRRTGDDLRGRTELLRAARRPRQCQRDEAGPEALETLFPELMENQPELFAHHYAEARLVEKSVSYWSKAGHRSAARSTMAEAAAQLRKGLDQLALLPETPERQRQKLEFWTALGAALNAVKGAAAPETGRAYASARELWERLGSPSEFFGVPYAQSRYHSTRGEFKWAMLLDEDLLRLSLERNDCAGLVLGHLASGRNLLMIGRLAPSRSHLEAALALHDPTSHRAVVRQAGLHPHVDAQFSIGFALFLLGFPDQALAQITAAIAEARRLVHPPSLASSLAVGGILLSLLRDHAVLDEWVAQLVALATEQGFPHWSAQGTIYRGWVKVNTGDVACGISLLRSGRDAFRATGAKLLLPHYMGLLATACGIVGQIEEGVTLLDDALQIVEWTGERWLEADLYRLKGQMLLRQGRSQAAEELYCKALDIAKEQEARIWELRAAVSLARLRRDQGRRAEARNLLAPIYGWFTEGFDTPDLKEVKALLDELR
jgi:predicted ATPase